MPRFVAKISNAQAGGSTNPAIVTFFVSSGTVASPAETVAQIVAFAHYMLPAAGTTVDAVEYALLPTGGTLPLPWPTVEYNILQAVDANLTVMAGYSVAFGSNALTARGVGAVLSKRTTTPGRSGRGRLTTPWLAASAVNAQGELLASSRLILAAGYGAYIRNVATALITYSAAVKDLLPFVSSNTGDHLITAWTVSSRLGRLRSRTA